MSGFSPSIDKKDRDFDWIKLPTNSAVWWLTNKHDMPEEHGHCMDFPWRRQVENLKVKRRKTATKCTTTYTTTTTAATTTTATITAAATTTN